MNMRFLASLLLLVAPAAAWADDVLNEPRQIPLTRDEMKEFLEDMKDRTPRIPLPELTEEDIAALGDRANSYESRLRYHYTPQRPDSGSSGTGGPRSGGGGSGGGTFSGIGRDPDPNMSLDYGFKVELFWIVSRTNNCQYCLGHQESKLINAGLVENQIAALDSDWLQFTPAEQAAFAFARKITYEPHNFGEADIEALRPYFTDLQILEMVFSTAGNNAINRWKEGTGVPQSRDGGIRIGRGETPPAAEDEEHSYLTPTSPQFQAQITTVAPVVFTPAAGDLTTDTVCNRPPLESREEVEAALAACRERTPRLPLVSPETAREVLAEEAPDGDLPQWVLLLANFPRDGRSRIVSQYRAEQEEGQLSQLMKARAAWIIARQDRAWYATGDAMNRLRELGQTDEQIFALDGDWSEFTPGERSLFAVARNLAASPVVLTDAEVAEALDLTTPHEVVQLITYVTTRASFDRITEAAGLQLED
jgi:alkylhydroperoxidase family enzyme